MKVVDVRKNFNACETKIMISIKNCAHLKDLSISELARNINIGINNPIFYKVLQYLRQVGIIEVTRVIGQTKLIKINQKALRDLIDEQKETNYWYDYFSDEHYISW